MLGNDWLADVTSGRHNLLGVHLITGQIQNFNKNHKIRLLSKPNTVNKTYQLQSTPTRNFNLPLATEKEEQRNRRKRKRSCLLLYSPPLPLSSWTIWSIIMKLKLEDDHCPMCQNKESTQISPPDQQTP
ncbi:hypothetical protein Avbf_16464 [Armadillidium vulgare]|nr:hypothetical protein Avbf_16464 [Armadillidium vulgare]